MDAVGEYSLQYMTGCILGRVPQVDVKTFPDIITLRVPVKVIFPEVNYRAHYGYVDSYSPRSRSFNFRALTVDGPQIISGLDFEAHKVFPSPHLNADIPRHLGDSIIIKQELFTVVMNHELFPIWVGNENLVYYAEDIQTLINMYNDYTILG